MASAADASFEPREHRGLTYLLGDFHPRTGEIHPIAPGVGWARMPVPGSLGHVNVWTLDDGDGVALVDTGFGDGSTRAAWEVLLAGPLSDRRITRIVGTHFHPDHIGLAGWLADRFDMRLWMTRVEYLTARMLHADARDIVPAEASAFQRGAGWPDAQIEAARAKGWGQFAAMVAPLPVSYKRIRDDDRLAFGETMWTAITGSGHSPEHLCLVDFDARVMIAGDQVLPRITSNISLGVSEPDADPLGDWLASITRFRRDLPGDLLVLPSHGLPFTGLHVRLDALAEGHARQLDLLAKKLAEAPARAVDCFSVLFARKIDEQLYGMATGEALAHLRRLEVTGQAVREIRDDVWWFTAR